MQLVSEGLFDFVIVLIIVLVFQYSNRLSYLCITALADQIKEDCFSLLITFWYRF